MGLDTDLGVESAKKSLIVTPAAILPLKTMGLSKMTKRGGGWTSFTDKPTTTYPVIFCLLAVFVYGCAAKPESIAATDVSPLLYKDLSCEDVETELRFAEQRREALYQRQRSDRNRDGWLNVLLPGMGAATVDHEGQIADIKGRIEQLERLKTRCDGESRQNEQRPSASAGS